MNKCKLGLDPNIVDLAAIGVVKSISRRPIKRFSKIKFLDREALFYPEGTEETRYSISGIINQDIASNIEKLLNLHNAQETVWLEQDEFVVGGVIDSLAFDYDEGMTRARYRIGFHEEPFWGRTLAQEHTTKKTYLADLDFAKKLREIFPTMAKHNFTLDRTNKKFVWEFILTNELEETGSFSMKFDDNQTAFWTSFGEESGTLGMPTLSNVTSPLKRNNNCLKIVVGSGTYAKVGIYHAYGGIDWSAYDFFAFWLYGNNTNTTIIVRIHTPDGLNKGEWEIMDDWFGWRRVVLPLRKPTTTVGTFDLTNIDEIHIIFTTTGTWYLDRGGIDVGSWVYLEMQVPDNLQVNKVFPTQGKIQGYSWNGTKWVGWMSLGDIDPNYMYLLSGDNFGQIYGAPGDQGLARYETVNRGEDAKKLEGWATVNPISTLTASRTYGCKKRGLVGICMPPWTGVDDLTGKFAINKCKLRIEVFWEDEKTTMVKGGEV